MRFVAQPAIRQNLGTIWRGGTLTSSGCVEGGQPIGSSHQTQLALTSFHDWRWHKTSDNGRSPRAQTGLLLHCTTDRLSNLGLSILKSSSPLGLLPSQPHSIVSFSLCASVPAAPIMNPSDTAEVAEIAKSAAFAHDAHPDEKRDRTSSELRPATSPEIEEVRETAEKGGFSSSAAYEDDAALQKDFPSPDELRTLRRVSGKIPWTAYTVAFVELCERFSYYGTTAVCTSVTTPLYSLLTLTVVNFIQRPLPEGSSAGATHGLDNLVPGALGMGQQASTGLTLCKLLHMRNDHLLTHQSILSGLISCPSWAPSWPTSTGVASAPSCSRLESLCWDIQSSSSQPSRRLSRIHTVQLLASQSVWLSWEWEQVVSSELVITSIVAII